VVAAAIAATPVGQDWWDHVRDWANDRYDWVQEQLG
jgi:hypothetical protein